MPGSHVWALSRVTGAALINALCAMLLGVVTARFLGPYGQGRLTLVTTIVALTVLAFSAGTGVSLRVRAKPHPSLADVKAYLGLSVAGMPAVGIVTGAVVLVASQTRVDTWTLAGSVTFGALSLIARQFSDLVQAYGRTNASITSVGFGFIVQTATFGGTVVMGHATVAAALGCGALGAVAQLAFSAFVLRPFAVPMRPGRQLGHWWQLVSQGSPTIGYGLGLLAMQRLDRLLLVPMAGAKVAGIYAVAATVAEVSRICSSATGQLLFVRTATTGLVTGSVRAIYWLAAILQSALLTVLAIGAPWIVDIAFGDAYQSSVPLLRSLLVAEFFMGLALMDSRIIMGLGQLRFIGAVTAVSVLIGLVLYAALISTQGATGAAIASIATYASFSSVLFLRRKTASTDREGNHANA